MSEEQKAIRSAYRGEFSGSWSGDEVGYHGIHKWLRREFGKANMCESKKCEGWCKQYDWAKIKGKKYERKRENFKKLCTSCHRKYDMTQEQKKLAIKNLIWNRV